MRALIALAILALAWGCNASNHELAATADLTAPVDRPKPQLAQMDCEVLETVFVDLTLWDDSALAFGSNEKRVILLHPRTEETSGMLSADQLDGEFRDSQYDIPRDLAENLRIRNVGSVSLKTFAPKRANVVMHDLSDIEQYEFDRRYPSARCFVHLWLPGYSDDGRLAIVRCWIGPTAHGATATYLLVNKSGTWQVKWRTMAHYV